MHGRVYFSIGSEVEELNMMVLHSAKYPLSEHTQCHKTSTGIHVTGDLE